MGITNGKKVDQSIARKAQQEPEGEMEGTETAAAEEAPQALALSFGAGPYSRVIIGHSAMLAQCPLCSESGHRSSRQHVRLVPIATECTAANGDNLFNVALANR
jgi:hypothetical protein